MRRSCPPKAYADLVRRLLAASGVSRVRWPSWELEEAVAAVAEGDDRWARLAARWVQPGRFGPRCSGLDDVLAVLCDEQLLVWSEQFDSYVIDTWCLAAAAPTETAGSIAIGAAWLRQRDQESRAAANS